ncbi:glycosyltransferase [Leifsonia shinshuensis]|uniref:glycosyltransferase n=1 Tax=Leifsonia shinshuensis TaxID=150026 RepID=UPI002857A0E5|nr:glycosyltransferase [Leifsonia shinshuensis]MDR6972181.1 glycosyltransferase involved in cell wall biosynthesis [Leifsonia shinshuensis]
MSRALRLLVWQVHGGWMDAFVRGRHTYLLPLDAEGGGGVGARDWPANVVDVPEAELASTPFDVVILQRLEEFDLVERLTGRRPGVDVPVVFVEHNTPQDSVPNSRHPLADRDDVMIAHVTHFNALFWDTGSTRTTVIEHGVVDYGNFFTGELPRAAAVINEPVRRWRVTGSDLLGGFAAVAPVDVFGMQVDGLAQALGVGADRMVAAGDIEAPRLFAEVGRRRVYVHPNRWTSLGLSLLESMTAGVPVVALDATDARRAVVPGVGVVSTDPAELHAAVRAFVDDPGRGAETGERAREWALERFGLGRYQADWDELLARWVG